jgi:hypothetical protein
MDNLTQELQAEAGAAEAEKVNEETATELGKFKDVKTLIEAYKNLEAEFTRRSQRLKDLENANKASEELVEAENKTQTDNPLIPSRGQEVLDKDKLVEAAMNSTDVKNAVITEYLQNTAKNKGVQFIASGVNVPAQRRAPVSVKEAGRLAQEFLNKREN